MKKILSFVLVLALAATLSLAVFADESDAADTNDVVESDAVESDVESATDTVESDAADSETKAPVTTAADSETKATDDTPKTGDSVVAVVIAAVAACGVAVAAKKFSK